MHTFAEKYEGITREFKDVVFEDVVFDTNSCVTLLSIVCYVNTYVKHIIIKHHILKHHILELPNYYAFRWVPRVDFFASRGCSRARAGHPSCSVCTGHYILYTLCLILYMLYRLYIYIYTRVYKHVQLYTYVCIHIYIYICIHIYYNICTISYTLVRHPSCCA